jgi:hypothetical protein
VSLSSPPHAVWANCEVAGGCWISLSFARVADNTLGAHGVASSSNSARPAHFVGGVLNAVAPRIAQHVIEIRSAHRNFGARQVRSHFGRNPPQLRIEPQARFPRRRNLCRQKRHSEPSPIHSTACGSRSPDWRPPPHPAAGHRSAFPRERTSWCGGRTPRASP